MVNKIEQVASHIDANVRNRGFMESAFHLDALARERNLPDRSALLGDMGRHPEAYLPAQITGGSHFIDEYVKHQEERSARQRDLGAPAHIMLQTEQNVDFGRAIGARLQDCMALAATTPDVATNGEEASRNGGGHRKFQR